MLTDHVGLHTSCGQGGAPGKQEERGVNSGEEGEVRLKGHVGRRGGKETRRVGYEGEVLKCSRGAEQRVRSRGRQLCEV